MVFFLYAVSGLLVLGGFGLALYGADNIRTDSGAVFAATGVSAAASGLLLLATTRVLTELRKIRVALEDGLARGIPVAGAVAEAAPALAPAAPPPPASSRPEVDMDEAQRELDLAPPAGAMAASAAATAGAAVAGGLAGQLLQQSRRRDEDDAAPPARPPVAAPDVFGEAVARRIDEDDDLLRDPDAGTAKEPESADAPRDAGPARGDATPDAAFSDLLDQEMADGVADAAARDGGSALPPVPTQTPLAEQEPEPLPTRPAERTLAATYASGENTYFMYSDGTIEAETPIGRFRFGSMDELRVFVETGEGGIPLAPPAPPGAA